MAIHYSTLAWEIPWTEEPGRLPSMESQKSRTGLSDERTTCKYTHTHTHTHIINTLIQYYKIWYKI